MRVALTWGALALSAALLLRSILAARKPAVVRPRLDLARQALQVGAIVAVIVITGVVTPLALTLVAGAAGAASGGYIGSTLQLTVRERRIVATRSLLGAAVWSAGLVGVQLAGLANRAGVLRLGQAVAWFGFGAAIGTFLGRGPALADLRRRVAAGAVASASVWLLAAALAARAPDDAEARTVAGSAGAWTLASVDQEPMTSDNFTTIAHTPGNVDAEVDVPGFQARLAGTYSPIPPEELPAGEFSVEVAVEASVSGDIQSYASLAVIELDLDGWTGAAVEAGVGCTDPIGAAPLTCTPPARQMGTFSWEVPQPEGGARFVIGIGVLNCQCAIFWTYEADAASSTTEPADTTPTEDGGSADNQTITEEEALATGVAVVLVAVLIGIIDLADVPLGGERGGPAPPGPAAADAPLPPPPSGPPDAEQHASAAARPAPPGRPPPPAGPPGPPGSTPSIEPAPSAPPPAPVGPLAPDPARIDALADQADDFAIAALPWIGDFDALDDFIRSIRDRSHAGQSLPGDEETLRAIRDALWTLARASQDSTATAEQTNAAILGAFETLLGVEAEFGKAAAGTFGPASATLYAGFVETIANRDKGLANALGHGAVGGASAFIGTRAAPSLDKLGTAMQAWRGGGRAAITNAAEDIGHQAVDTGGDVSQVDLGRTGRAAGIGFVTGAGGQVAGAGVRGGDLPAPGLRTGDLPTPRPRITGVPDPPVPAPPRQPPPPPRFLPDEPLRTPQTDTTPAPADVFPPPGPRPVDSPGVRTGDPTDLFPDSPELPPRLSVPRNADGYFLDPGGNPLVRPTLEGLRTPDGTPVTRMITDSQGRPIGYEQADGVQVISFAHPDPGRIPTAGGGRVMDPDALPPTTEQPRT